MQFKSLIAASVVAFTALSSHAASTDWAQHALLESALGLSPGGSISDTYSFTLDVSSEVASSVSSLGAISAGSYTLFASGGDGMRGTSDDIGLGAWGFSGAPVVNTVLLGPGSYYYLVTGTAQGLAAYSINSAASPVAVPEPETYAMLGAGLGVIGFVAARRRRP